MAGMLATSLSRGLTAGSWGQGPDSLWPTWALAPAFSTSQPSAGQECGSRAYSTRVPTEPCPASWYSAGVACAETSLQRRPGMPTITTWLADAAGAAVVVGVSAFAHAGSAALTTAVTATATAASPAAHLTLTP